MKFRALTTLLLALTLLVSRIVGAQTCGGLPALEVTTPPDLCVGIAASGLHMPRGLLPLPDGRVLVTELGGWVANSGSLKVLSKTASGSWMVNTVLDKLDRPHGLALGPDNKVWIGEASRIIRIAQNEIGAPAPKIEVAIADLPGEGRHPLKSFVFSKRGDLFLNIGSASDNCDKEADQGAAPVCHEASQRGLVRHYTVDRQGKLAGGEIYADGLRNSVGLLVTDEGRVLQVENSRDAINKPLKLKSDEELPHDELNELQAGQHYGWPYCYDKAIPSPEFPQADCSTTTQPLLLLPAHAAPLALTMWRGELVIAYHGYRKHGHRLVSLPLDAQGTPQFPARTLIDDWNGKSGPGAPVDVRVLDQEHLLISDDKHGQVLILQSRKP